MSSFDFLSGVRVIEVSQLGPDSLGGILADMGASVVKIENPPAGDPVRFAGSAAVGDADGVGYLHLRWNRGKRSIGVDLRSEGGARVFRRLACSADVVIEGLRGGSLEKLGFGYSALRELNPKIIFCSVSGLGLSGPYHTLGSHAPAFDAVAGLIGPHRDGIDKKYADSKGPLVGMYAMGMQAAIGVLAALYRSKMTGEGALIEVAAVDASANWLADEVDSALNRDKTVERRGFHDESGLMANWPRFEYYRTRDRKVLFFQALKLKFWRNFCTAVGRPDLLASGGALTAAASEALWCSLQAIFGTRDLADWIDLFVREDIPGCPVNDVDGLVTDPHYLARSNTYDVELAGVGYLRLTGTPIKVDGQHFAPDAAPGFAQHTTNVLRETAKFSADEIAALRASGAVV